MKGPRRSRPVSRIYSEIRQTRPFERVDQELAVALIRTGDVFQHGVARALAPLGVSHEQYNALRILRGAGEEGHPTLEISRRLISRSPNITRLLDKLIEKDLARRDRNDEDRRRAIVRITPAGREFLKKCDRVVDGAVGKLGCLSRKESILLIGFLDRIREAVAVPTVMEGVLGVGEAESPT